MRNINRTTIASCAAVAPLAAGGALAGGTLSGKFAATITGAPSPRFDGVWTLNFVLLGRFFRKVG